MGKKEQKSRHGSQSYMELVCGDHSYSYGSQRYIELVCGVKVEPAPRNTKTSVHLRQFLPKGWTSSARDVWREKGQGPQGGHFILLTAVPDEQNEHGALIARLGDWMNDLGLALVECVCIEFEAGNRLGAIVELES